MTDREMLDQHFMGARIGASACADRIRAMIDKEPT